MPDTPFTHIALKVDAPTQDEVAARLAAASYQEPATFVLEHGYCRSLHVRDPNGLLLELTADHPDAERSTPPDAPRPGSASPAG